MRTYSLKQKSLKRSISGMWITIHAPDLVEQLGTTGFDFLCMDAEHSAFDISDIAGLVRAADIANLPSIIRVSQLGQDVSRVLDAGAAGVMVPRIGSAKEAREFVRCARFAPLGARGAGACRAAAYGAEALDYIARANDDLLLIAQIESLEGLESVDEIARVDGLDALFVGPLDLAVSLGTTVGSPQYEGAVQTVFNAARRHGRIAGIACITGPQVTAARQAGASIILFGHDRSFVVQGAKALIEEANRLEMAIDSD